MIDDHSRVAYAEIHSDDKTDAAIGALRRAVAWIDDPGVSVERVPSDNGSCYRSHAWGVACADLRITHTPSRVTDQRPWTSHLAGL